MEIPEQVLHLDRAVALINAAKGWIVNDKPLPKEAVVIATELSEATRHIREVMLLYIDIPPTTT